MGKNKKVIISSTSILRSFASCFFLSDSADIVKTTNAKPATGPETTMVAAGKHFSSKVRLI